MSFDPPHGRLGDAPLGKRQRLFLRHGEELLISQCAVGFLGDPAARAAVGVDEALQVFEDLALFLCSFSGEGVPLSASAVIGPGCVCVCVSAGSGCGSGSGGASDSDAVSSGGLTPASAAIRSNIP